MKHLPTDEHGLLRKQLHEEIQALFNSKLKEAKRDQEHAEAELESASEKWRSARRRLNAEIDRLEAALAQTKDKQARRTVDTAARASGVDSAEASRLRTAAEEGLQKAAAAWQAEKTRLLAGQDRLERALADAIEKTNNPLRTTLHIKEEFEQKLNEAASLQHQLEEDFRNAEREWAHERLRLAGKVGTAGLSEARPKPAVQPAVRPNNDRQLKDLQQKFAEASSRFDAEREQLRKNVDSLKSQVDQSVQAEARLVKELASIRAQSAERDKERDKERDEDRANNLNRKQQMERAFTETREQLSRTIADQLRKENGRKTDELIGERIRLSAELQAVSEMLASERERFISEIAHLKQSSRVLPSPERNSVAAKSAVASLDCQLKDLQRRLNEASSHFDGQREQLQKTVDSLKSQLDDSAQSEARLVKELASIRAQWAKRDQERDDERTKERVNNLNQKQQMESAFAETREQLSRTIADQLRKENGRNNGELIEERGRLSGELQAIGEKLESERRRFVPEVASLKETRIPALAEAGFRDEAVEGELIRIEHLISEILKVIDNPETELSMVIRKNVEKAELDAYLTGILFSRGQGKPLA